ncbi:MAG: hypothetical protein J2P30_04945 [Actinobacteria bacterium]|nr:hypothetical protein [Actinomycetota bacterium]
MTAQWQIRFDDGHQQRYLPDRQAVLRYVLGVGFKAARAPARSPEANMAELR